MIAKGKVMKKLKKLGILFIAIATVLTLMAVPAAAAYEAYGAATVTASILNIRSGPDTSYSRVGFIARNSRLVILEKGSGNWYKINYQGTEGYVHKDYLKDVLTVENFNATGKITASGVRVRSIPSTDGSILTVLSRGTSVQVIGINKGWYKVITGDITGYVRSDLMTISGAPASANVTSSNTSSNSSNSSSSSSSSGSSSSSNSSVGQQIADLAKSFVGYRYVYGEESPSKGFDCSGLVYYCYGQFGYKLARTASKQYANHGTSVAKSDLRAGDLVFFSSSGNGVTHVGIYIGNGDFVHASTSKTGVIISSLDSAYYTRVWYGAKRIV